MAEVFELPGLRPEKSVADVSIFMQWLHRSAYSFGGLCEKDDFLDPGNPDTAQKRSNLVLGTYAANTRMIR